MRDWVVRRMKDGGRSSRYRAAIENVKCNCGGVFFHAYFYGPFFFGTEGGRCEQADIG